MTHEQNHKTIKIQTMRATIDRPRDLDGNTYLHELAKQGAPRERIIEAVQLFGANPEILNKEKQTPLALAITNGNVATILALTECGARLCHDIGGGVHFNALCHATELGRADILELILALGGGAYANVPGIDTVYRLGAQNLPLYVAATKGFPVLCQLLLEAGAFPERLSPAGAGRTTLAHAAELHNQAVCRLLLDAGADPSAQGRHGMGPLHIAINSRILPLIELFIMAGADLDAPDKDDETPLMAATRVHRHDIVKLLIAAGADVNFQLPQSGKTALMIAAERKQPEAALELLASGANPLLRDVFNRTASAYVNQQTERGLYEFLRAEEDVAVARLFKDKGHKPKA